MNLEFWYMLPIAIAVSTTAMASGIGGATFFAPILMLGVGVEPGVAIGTGLITEVFGFASGLTAYARKRLIDYRLGGSMLVVTIPAALIGAWAAGVFPPELLKLILAIGLLAVAVNFLRAPNDDEIGRIDTEINREFTADNAQTCIVAAGGRKFCYTACNRTEGRVVAATGGLFVGLISTGLGELSGVFLMRRCRVPSPVAVATTVFVVAVTVLVASAGHFAQFVSAGSATMDLVFSLVVFTIPGVIIGGQLGPVAARRIPQVRLERILAVLFILVASVTVAEVALR